jgi:hypothetical protein
LRVKGEDLCKKKRFLDKGVILARWADFGVQKRTLGCGPEFQNNGEYNGIQIKQGDLEVSEVLGYVTRISRASS